MHSPIPRLLLLLIWLLLSTLGACRQSPHTTPAATQSTDSCLAPPPTRLADTPTESRLRAHGLVDVQEVDPTIQVHLVYATARNFTDHILYTDIHKAFMLPQLADKLAAAQRQLHRSHPHLSLLVLDAARPLSIQRQMFHLVQGTPLNIYVSNPLHGPGLHNYGAAVDITLVDSLGHWLPMGSDFDHFGPESHIRNESQLLADGRITQQECHNRQLLRSLMQQQGLQPLYSEWWHFNLMSRSRARQQLKPINF